MNEGANQIVVYQPNETVRLDVRLEGELDYGAKEELCPAAPSQSCSPAQRQV